ncbi:hypothetical protein RDI58_018153 [Solanum bulbocastanum]|uniref:Uncharacterized protein n=1 Tax=Solanum bulbocastanum TaxID=147425 RepID=A0AAN8TA52_SOLBU
MANFINHWSTMARNPSAPIPSFQFVGGSIFPPVSSSIAEAILKSKTRGNHPCISKKYLFSRSKINSLKAMIAAESGTKSSSSSIDPSSVEAASAFVYKCMASNSTGPSVFTQSVNLQPIMKNMLPEEFQGNASFLLMAPEIADPTEIKLHRLISEVWKEKEMYFSREWETKNLVSTTMFEKVKSLQNQLERDDDDVDVYNCTSLSKLRISDMDNGWGGPRRVCLRSVPINKKIFLMDNQNEDGIEVLFVIQLLELLVRLSINSFLHLALKFVFITNKSISIVVIVNPISWAPSEENTSLHGGPVPFTPSVAVPLREPDGNSPKKPRLMGESEAVIK